MSESARILAAMGAVPAGVQPKTITEENGEPGNYDISTLGRVIRVLNQQKLKVEADAQKKMETAKKKMDMYKTLRDAGYDSKSAYESVIKNEMKVPGEEDFSSIKSPTERILNKMSKGIALTAGEQQVYDETIKKKQPAQKNQDLLDESIKAKVDLTKAQTEKIKLGKTPNQQRMYEQILRKIANGMDLTTGEQKIYDEVIKKQAKQNGSGDALSDILDPENNEETVKVQHPDGRKGTILKSKLPAALAAGFKKL